MPLLHSSPLDRLSVLLGTASLSLVAGIDTVVVGLDLLDDPFHLLHLLLPLGLAELGLAVEQLHVGLAVRAAETIPESGELAVVVVKVQVVHGVTCGTVDDGRVCNVFTVV